MSLPWLSNGTRVETTGFGADSYLADIETARRYDRFIDLMGQIAPGERSRLFDSPKLADTKPGSMYSIVRSPDESFDLVVTETLPTVDPDRFTRLARISLPTKRYPIKSQEEIDEDARIIRLFTENRIQQPDIEENRAAEMVQYPRVFFNPPTVQLYQQGLGFDHREHQFWIGDAAHTVVVPKPLQVDKLPVVPHDQMLAVVSEAEHLWDVHDDEQGIIDLALNYPGLRFCEVDAEWHKPDGGSSLLHVGGGGDARGIDHLLSGFLESLDDTSDVTVLYQQAGGAVLRFHVLRTTE